MFLWPTVITGLVGVAGIAGAICSAWLTARSATADLRLRIIAENERARLADKRQTYAAYQTALNAVITAAIAHRNSNSDLNREKRRAAKRKVDEALEVMYQRASELWLIADQDVRKHTRIMVVLLRDFVAATYRNVKEGPDIDAIFPLRRDLTRAMRADLGEPE